MNAQGPDLLAAWRALTGDTAAAREVWTDLVERWSEPQRHYHGLAHLTAVLGIVDRHADEAHDPDAVRLAAWFHDAVYDPTRTDNEERSADLAAACLTRLDLPPDRVADVQRLVRITTTHGYDEGDADAALLCDADLAVLAAPPAAYVGYANAIRAEYAHVSDPDFRAGRADVLRDLLARDRLYGTQGLGELELPARTNLRAELCVLEQDSGGRAETSAH